MKTMLITGGAGFLGSHLCDFFIDKGYRIICMDNLITGSLDNIAHLRDRPDFLFLRHNVSNYIDLEALFEDKGIPGPRVSPGEGGWSVDNLSPDWILHFASPASPVDYLRHPIKTLKVGSLGTHNTLGLAKKYKAGFLLASTSEVYGDPQVNPQPETYWGHVNTIGPRGVYDEAKRFAEALTMAYHRTHKINTRIVRIFNTYGPRMRVNDGRAVPNFISQALTSQPITIYGDGTQTRSFCYVTDLIDGLYKLISSDENKPVNIGNPHEFTIREAAEKIIEITNSSSQIIYQDLPVDDPKVRRPDITRAKKLLNWQPKVDFYDGLCKTITSLKEINKK